MPQKTREQMAAIILRGGSVILKGGKVATTLADLPSPVEIAGSDPARRAELRRDLEARLAATRDELAALGGDPTEAGGTSTGDVPVGGEGVAPASASTPKKPAKVPTPSTDGDGGSGSTAS